MFKVGQKVIFLGNDNQDVSKQVLKGGTITRAGKDTVWLDNQHKAEDQVYASFLWPDNDECRLLLSTTLLMKARHRAEDNELFKTMLELNNKCIREGLK